MARHDASFIDIPAVIAQLYVDFISNRQPQIEAVEKRNVTMRMMFAFQYLLPLNSYDKSIVPALYESMKSNWNSSNNEDRLQSGNRHIV